MICEKSTCYRCGRDLEGERWRLMAMRQSKPYSWKSTGWNRYYCGKCAVEIMADVEIGDYEGRVDE